MKNIKDSLFEWRNHFITTFFGALFFALPSIVVFSPSLGSNFFDYKWLIFGFIIASIIGYNILIFRCENYEDTIEKMNDEIEILKDEVKLLKKKDKE